MPTTPSPYAIWIPVVAAIITGVFSALLTQFLTWKFGLSRFVREKEISRRMEWHEKAFKAILVRREIVIELATLSHSKHDFVVVAPMLISVANGSQELGQLLAEAQIFASAKAYKVYRSYRHDTILNREAFEDKFDAIHDGLIKEQAAAQDSFYNAVEQFCEKELDYLDDAKTVIADDIREALGLEKLNDLESIKWEIPTLQDKGRTKFKRPSLRRRTVPPGNH